MVSINHTRNCPLCKQTIVYSNASRLRRAVESNSICRPCNAKKTGAKNIGRRASKSTLKKLSDRSSGRKNPMFGMKRPSYIGAIVAKRNVKLWTGRKHTEKTLIKMRESALNRIIQDRGCISYNVKACAIFDEINREKGWNGQHALHGGEKQVIGYSVDYYEPILNIVIEFDEKFHSKQIDKDISRQQKIIKYLGCKFYRIPYNQHWTNIIT